MRTNERFRELFYNDAAVDSRRKRIVALWNLLPSPIRALEAERTRRAMNAPFSASVVIVVPGATHRTAIELHQYGIFLTHRAVEGFHGPAGVPSKMLLDFIACHIEVVAIDASARDGQHPAGG